MWSVLLTNVNNKTFYNSSNNSFKLFPICLTYLPSGTLCMLPERLLILLELPALLRLSPTSLSLSLSLSPLLEPRLEVPLSRCPLTDASDIEPCKWDS